MSIRQLYILGTTPAVQFAVCLLARKGISMIDHPTPEISHLLLDVPSFQADGRLKSGKNLIKILETLPESLVVAGGNLSHPGLKQYSTIDFLQDPQYTARNADITARCALRLAAAQLRCTYDSLPVLVIGWGRIGKCLCRHLSAVGADVTLLARKDTDLAMASALGYAVISTQDLPRALGRYRVIFNTAPAMVLPRALTEQCRNCKLIDLASTPGIDSESAVRALGLPGLWAPESSGALIAETFLRLTKEV